MTYNVFGGTLNLALSISLIGWYSILCLLLKTSSPPNCRQSDVECCLGYESSSDRDLHRSKMIITVCCSVMTLINFVAVINLVLPSW